MMALVPWAQGPFLAQGAHPQALGPHVSLKAAKIKAKINASAPPQAQKSPLASLKHGTPDACSLDDAPRRGNREGFMLPLQTIDGF